jgi:putative endonuclease
MNTNKETGNLGEDLAVDWLIAKGDHILHRNWRHSYYEIDIITMRKDILCFIEVKTRRSLFYGMPEEAVTASKIMRLMCAGSAYLTKYPDFNRIQYDILSIVILENGNTEFFLIEDVSL